MSHQPVRIRDVIREIEAVAPPETAAEWDNVGLQTGDPDRMVTSVTACLDCTPDVLAEAGGGGLVVVHHPPIFRPLRALPESAPLGRLLALAIRGETALYAAHTNFDVCEYSPSRACCERLELRHVRRVEPAPASGFDKIVVFVPREHYQEVLDAMADAGAGRIGDYVKCSFAAPGQGTFLGLAGTHPAVGQAGRLETAQEYRLELRCPRHLRHRVIAAMIEAHPYEEVAYDVYALADVKAFHQATWRGEWDREVPLGEAAERVQEALCEGADVRVAGNLDRPVRRVAVASGSAARELHHLRDVDVFITGDVDHHAALAARESGLAVIAAGHYHTEKWFADQVARLLAERMPQLGVPVVAADETPPFSMGV